MIGALLEISEVFTNNNMLSSNLTQFQSFCRVTYLPVKLGNILITIAVLELNTIHYP